jgi:hypothetical protein
VDGSHPALNDHPQVDIRAFVRIGKYIRVRQLRYTQKEISGEYISSRKLDLWEPGKSLYRELS